MRRVHEGKNAIFLIILKEPLPEYAAGCGQNDENGNNGAQRNAKQNDQKNPPPPQTDGRAQIGLQERQEDRSRKKQRRYDKACRENESSVLSCKKMREGEEYAEFHHFNRTDGKRTEKKPVGGSPNARAGNESAKEQRDPEAPCGHAGYRRGPKKTVVERCHGDNEKDPCADENDLFGKETRFLWHARKIHEPHTRKKKNCGKQPAINAAESNKHASHHKDPGNLSSSLIS